MYFLTSIFLPAKGSDRKRCTRTFGYFLTLQEAMKAREENRGNMMECLYNYLIIERFDPGIHSLAEEVYWAKWDDERNKWKAIDQPPPELVGIINFAIG